MFFGDSAFSHEEVVGPEHVMRLDGNACILHQLRHFGTSKADRLCRARLFAYHVVLGAPAKDGEAFSVVTELVAQRFGPFIGRQHLPGPPSLRGHPGDADKLLEVQFDASAVRRIRLLGKDSESLLQE
jgi:hypothetical protein